jgi:carbon-monoxide dehydrogenase catalytic subunit
VKTFFPLFQNIVGCNNPKIVFERAIIDIADKLLANNILIFTNGCASYPLMKLGYCTKGAAERASEPLRSILKARGLPPVLHVGECLDNTRSFSVFKTVSEALGRPLYKMPLAYLSPEWSNEKGVASPLSFRTGGISSYHCVHPYVFGSEKVMYYLFEGSRDTLGSVMVVRTDPKELAEKLIADLEEKSCGIAQ